MVQRERSLSEILSPLSMLSVWGGGGNKSTRRSSSTKRKGSSKKSKKDTLDLSSVVMTPGRLASTLSRGMERRREEEAANSREVIADPMPWDVGSVAQPAVDYDGLLDQYLAALPAVDKGAYLAPFLRAERAVRDAHAAALPSISSVYEQLAKEMGAQQQDWRAALDTNEQAMVRDQRRLIDAQRQHQGGELASLRAQGVETPAILSDVNAQNAANVRALEANQATDREGLEALRRVQEASMRDRQSAVPQMEAAARSAADVNLVRALSDIGMRRADAERAYQQDVAARASDEARLRAEFARAKQESQVSADPLAELKAQMDWEKHQMDVERWEREKALQESGTLDARGKPRDASRQFMAERLPRIQAEYPKASRAFLDIVSEAKSLEQALSIYNASTPEDWEEIYNITPNDQIFMNWFREYYG